MEGHAVIATDVLARYAADAARDVPGVHGLVEGKLPGSRGVRVTEDDGAVSVEVHVGVAWGVSIPDVGRAVQARVAEYLARMADVRPQSVNVVVDEIAG